MPHYFVWRSESTTSQYEDDRTRFIGRWSLLRHDDKGTSCERFPTLKSRCCSPALSVQIKHYVWHRTRRLSPSRPGKISPSLSTSRGIVKSIELIRSQTSAKLRPIICAVTLNGILKHYDGCLRSSKKRHCRMLNDVIIAKEHRFKVHNLSIINEFMIYRILLDPT